MNQEMNVEQIMREEMRDDWNRRAVEDAHYYVAFGRHEQDEEEFLATASDVLRGLERELKRGLPGDNPRARRALEIGCGPGRLMKPLSAQFGEIHGIDVSDEMIRIARARLAPIPHAHAHTGSGADLRQFASESFDFLYSYAVFQHIPSKDVVFSYLEDAARVLKPGGLMRFQVNNLEAPRTAEATWHGCSVDASEIRAYAQRHGLLLLALEGVQTQYMWVTIRKPAPTPDPTANRVEGPREARIRRVTNSESSEPVAPQRGRYAAISIWLEKLPQHADLLSLDLQVDGHPARLSYLSPPEPDGLQQLNAVLPPNLPTGLQPLRLLWQGKLLAEATLRIIPAPPAVPRIVEVVDGLDYLSGTRIVSGSIKVFVEELYTPNDLVATINGLPARDYSILCTDPMPPRHEVNFLLPDGLPAGSHTLHLQAGRRLLGKIPIEVIHAN